MIKECNGQEKALIMFYKLELLYSAMRGKMIGNLRNNTFINKQNKKTLLRRLHPVADSLFLFNLFESCKEYHRHCRIRCYLIVEPSVAKPDIVSKAH